MHYLTVINAVNRVSHAGYGLTSTRYKDSLIELLAIGI